MKDFECFISSSNIKNCRFEENFYYDKKIFNNSSNVTIDVDLLKIKTCKDCGISYTEGVTGEFLDNFYSSIYTKESYNKDILLIKKNIFYEFNRRFFSQTLFFLERCKLFDGIKVLEIGPNAQGILPTLKLFQKNIDYYYIDQNSSELINSIGGKKIANYFDPVTSDIPKVDLIWLSHSMEHINPIDLKNVFKKLHSSLNEYGNIFIEIPDDIYLKNFKFPHVLFFKKKFLELFFNYLNFDIISLCSFGNSKRINVLEQNNSRKKEKISISYILKFLPKIIKNFLLKNLIYYAINNNQYNENTQYIRLIIEKK